MGTTSGRDSLCGTEPGGRSHISQHLPLHGKKEKQKRKAKDGKEEKEVERFQRAGLPDTLQKEKKQFLSPPACGAAPR